MTAPARAPFEVRPGLCLVLGATLIAWVVDSFLQWSVGLRSTAAHYAGVLPAFYFLCICIHDGTHHLLHRNRRLNRIAGFVMSLSIGMPFPLLQTSHLSHHRLVNKADDPERAIYEARWWELPFRLLLLPLFYLPTFKKLSLPEQRSTLVHALVVLAALAWGGPTLWVGWALPAVLAIAWFAVTTVYVPHCAYSERLMRFMHAHSGYHEDHHRDVRYPAPQYFQLRAWHLAKTQVNTVEAKLLGWLSQPVW